MDILDKLLQEAKVTKIPAETHNVYNITKGFVSLPDAIVLVEVHITCKYCYAKYKYPNLHLLARRGRQRLRIKYWIDKYYTLPREIFIVEEESDVCQNCFNAKEMFVEASIVVELKGEG